MSVTKGVCIAILLNLSLAVMNLATKMLVEVGYSAIQVLVVSAWFAIIPLSAYRFHTGRRFSFKHHINWKMALHIVLSMSEAALIFYAFGHGNLAEVSIIISVCPLIVALFSHFLLNERMSKSGFALVLVSIFGVALIVKPQGNISEHLPILAGVLGAVIYSISQVWVRKISSTISSFALLSSTYLGIALLGPLFIMGSFQPLQSEHSLLFLMLGVCDVFGIFLLYFVLSKVSANVISPFQYTRILWGLVFGYVFFGDIIDIWSTIGLVIIILAGVKFVQLHVKKEKKLCQAIKQIL